MMAEDNGQVLRLADEILHLSENTLLVRLRFLDMAFGYLAPETVPSLESALATDGKALCYAPIRVLRQYKEESPAFLRDYLHLILHCVLGHPFLHRSVDKPCWDLASDICVENIISELELPTVRCSRAARQQRMLERLRGELRSLTAENIYRYYQKQELSAEELIFLRENFRGDSHELWYSRFSRIPLETDEAAEMEEAGMEPADGPAAAKTEETDGRGAQRGIGARKGGFPAEDADTEKFWRQTARRMQTDLATFSKRQGRGAGSLTRSLQSVTRERMDYGEFLRQFCVTGEAMKINEDEFDYIYYSYGMHLYGKMPLVEPLEYKDTKRIREFVIAIDTSASVSRKLVQQFMQKTYNILLQQENFFTKINLHIIQCDAKIQEDAKITSKQEFDEYLEHMTLRGFGGTDFRPVFDYVEELREKKEFTDLRGLLYFTDGRGDFPEKMPDYRTAFVFLDDEDERPGIPVWAIRLTLKAEEIGEGEEL